MASSAKQIRQVIQPFLDAGWKDMGVQGSGHRLLISPGGSRVLAPARGTGGRGDRNLRAALRRIDRREGRG